MALHSHAPDPRPRKTDKSLLTISAHNADHSHFFKVRPVRPIAVLALPILLNACALPAAFSIASLAVDGISYATSGKSVSDHALSAVANEDCAMWRALKARPICRDRDVPETMVAAAPESEVPAAVLAAAPAAGGSTAPEIAITETHDEFGVTAAAFAAAPAGGATANGDFRHPPAESPK